MKLKYFERNMNDYIQENKYPHDEIVCNENKSATLMNLCVILSLTYLFSIRT